MSKQAKLMYLVRRGPGVAAEEFEARWVKHARRAAAGPWVGVDAAAEFGATPGAAEIGLGEKYAGAGVIWTVDGPATLASMASLPADLRRDQADVFAPPLPEAACETVEHSFRDEGVPGVVIIAFLRRNRNLDHAEFSSHWRERHAPLFMEVMGRHVRRYVQNHAEVAGPAAGDQYDGVAEIGFDSLQAILEVLEDPEYLRLVRPDEERLLEVERQEIVITNGFPLASKGREQGTAASS